MPLELGDQNLISFVNSGFEHLHVTPNINSMRILDKIGFLEFGQGYYGWMIAINTAVLRIAKSFGISLVFFSEDGEIEYGGSTERKNIAAYGIDYIKKAYLSATYDHVIQTSGLSKKDLYWFEFDSAQFADSTNFRTHTYELLRKLGSVQELLGGKGILWVKGIRRGCVRNIY